MLYGSAMQRNAPGEQPAEDQSRVVTKRENPLVFTLILLLIVFIELVEFVRVYLLALPSLDEGVFQAEYYCGTYAVNSTPNYTGDAIAVVAMLIASYAGSVIVAAIGLAVLAVRALNRIRFFSHPIEGARFIRREADELWLHVLSQGGHRSVTRRGVAGTIWHLAERGGVRLARLRRQHRARTSH